MLFTRLDAQQHLLYIAGTSHGFKFRRIQGVQANIDALDAGRFNFRRRFRQFRAVSGQHQFV